MKRAVPTVTFQPSKENHRRLRRTSRKRGLRTLTINVALENYFADGERQKKNANPAAKELLEERK